MMMPRQCANAVRGEKLRFIEDSLQNALESIARRNGDPLRAIDFLIRNRGCTDILPTGAPGTARTNSCASGSRSMLHGATFI